MLVNFNYAEVIAKAKANNASSANFDNARQTVQPVPAITAQKDTVTLSDAALALMSGVQITEQPPTYVNPASASTLLAMNQQQENHTEEVAKDTRFEQVMESFLDKRLGVDREKLKEIDAMMEEIAKNEDMSDQEKEEALALLQEMREKVISEAREVQDIAQQLNQEEEVVKA